MYLVSVYLPKQVLGECTWHHKIWQVRLREASFPGTAESAGGQTLFPHTLSTLVWATN